MGNQLHDPEIEDIVCASILFESGALASVQLTTNQPKAYSIRQIAGEKGMIVIQDVQGLSSDQDEQILVGIYEGRLSEMRSRLTGIAEQPQIEWRKFKLCKVNRFRRLVSRSALATRVFEKIRGPQPDEPHPVSLLMNSFGKAITDGATPLVSGEGALPVVELINAIVLSAMRKKTVDLPLDRDEYDKLFEGLSAGTIKVPRLREGLTAVSTN
jgi:predicted dehydrogenase